MLYQVTLGPEELPAVRARDLEAAWDLVAARRVPIGAPRRFRFEGPAGTLTVAVIDREARRWAGAVDRVAGLHTCQGIALCLRLLGLVGLLARMPDSTHAVSPALLRAVADAPLTPAAELSSPSIESLLSQGAPA